MASHIKNGHKYHLWTYAPVDAPEGVTIEDGNEILPESEIFEYSGDRQEGGGSVSAFSNWFRYKLLLERGGWWCDTDVVCLKPFDFKRDYVIASEEQKSHNGSVATTCVMKAPPNSSLMRYCWERCRETGKDVRWGVIGPCLLNESVSINHLADAVVPYWVFCPVNWRSFEDAFSQFSIGKSYAVHLWNEMWRRENRNKDGQYNTNCLYEQLKERYSL